MARRARIEYEGAFYHVITRGNQRQKIFSKGKKGDGSILLTKKAMYDRF